MADANSTSTGNIESHLSLTESALEMAREMIEVNGRQYAVALALLVQLSPASGEEPDDINAFRLAEVLTEIMGDCAQNYRLIDRLEAMRQKVAA